MKINIGVGGRFHADRMADAFSSAGHEVRAFTSYPGRRFKVAAPANLKTHVPSELIFRAAGLLGFESWGESAKMETLGTWLARECKKKPADINFIWSSFALETFEQNAGGRRVLVRDSTHISHQFEILAEEYRKYDASFEINQTCLKRELAEYQLADSILVLSQFAKKTFIERGIPAHKIVVFPLGVNTQTFKPSPITELKLPLQVVYFGTLSFRKGVQYLLEATQGFRPTELKLTLIGPVQKSFQPLLESYHHFTYLSARPHETLITELANKHVYVFPTLEDGFPNSLIQAMASGLVPITTAECGPAELIQHNQQGFLIPTKNPGAIADHLNELIQNPTKFLSLRSQAIHLAQANTWPQYSAKLNTWLNTLPMDEAVIRQAR